MYWHGYLVGVSKQSPQAMATVNFPFLISISEYVLIQASQYTQ